ncbi:hypothetical protein GGQ68_000319 [Sagittula marina]|uniref:Uncharacterized protein n=1 Tax=Sagittula marina TaxID=943940 RepID=A0A7W6DJ68_9RHOB|nr:hypothetical protein [Sagittula marina]
MAFSQEAGEHKWASRAVLKQSCQLERVHIDGEQKRDGRGEGNHRCNQRLRFRCGQKYARQIRKL